MPASAARGTCAVTTSKVVLVYVELVKQKRFSQQDVVALNLKLPEDAGLEGSVRGSQVTPGERLGGINREIAQVLCPPQDYGISDSVFNVLTVFAGEPKADYFHLAGF